MHSAFLRLEQVLPLRSEVLRNGGNYEQCRFPTDALPGTFHAGMVDAQGLVYSIVSCHAQSRPPLQGLVYQLRGMATAPAYQGKGLGKILVEFVMQHIKQLGGDGIWCNARKNAYTFYQSLGFEFMSSEFDIPGIGPHREMFLTWDKTSTEVNLT